MELLMINERNIEETVSTVTKVAESIIENMPIGTRFTTKQFIERVVEETHVPVAIAAGITALVVNNCDNVKPRAGRNGGIFRVASTTVSQKDISAAASALASADMNEEETNERA